MAEKPLNSQLYDAVAELATLGDQLHRATRRLDDARREETAAINRVNEAQKKFDELVALTKKTTAPSGTDWARAQRKTPDPLAGG